MHVEHTPPCTELREISKLVYQHEQAIKNNTDWQERMESRLNQLMYIALGSLATGLLSSLGIIASLLANR